MMDRSAIAVKEVSKVYPGGVRALDDISLSVREGEWVALMGSSGSGKTTLLNLLDGLDRPSSGDVTVVGMNLGRMDTDEATVFRREHIGLIFQQFHLVPYLTALENVMLAQYYHSMVDEAQALRALGNVELDHRADHLPAQLSGGEQQRVCIARALINEPEIILADEPTGNLDETNEQKVLDIFGQLHDVGKTLVVVTHNRELGLMAERTIVLHHGRIVEPSTSSSQDVGRPSSESSERCVEQP